MKLALVCLVLGAVYSQGAVIPSQFEADQLISFVENLFLSPESLSAVGFVRERRHADDEKVFNFEKLGVRVGIKYVDATNRWKGGRVHIEIDNLKKIIPSARSEKVDVLFNLDGGVAPLDGLFHWEIEYTLEHSNVEKGKVVIDRSKDGAFWVTKVKSESLNKPAVQLIPSVELNMRSDRQTALQGDYKSQRIGSVTIDVDRVPGQSIDAVIDVNGKNYIINGKLDRDNHNLVIDIKAGDATYQVNLDWEKTADKVSVKGSVDLQAGGVYRVEYLRENTEKMMLKVDFNGRPLVNVKVKAKIAPNSYKFEARYTAVSIGEGKLRLGLETAPNQVLQIQHMPKGGQPFKLECSRKVDGLARHWNFQAERDGVTLSKYSLDLVPKITGDIFEVDVNSNAHLSDQSAILTMMKKNGMCLYECFNDRQLTAKLFFNNANRQMKLNIELTKDGEKVLSMEMDTTKTPWSLTLTAPRLLKSLLPASDTRDTIWAKLNFVSGKSVTYTGNNPSIQEFKIEKSGDQYIVTKNGQEVMKNKMAKGNNAYTFDFALPDGRALNAQLQYESLDKDHNTVTLKLDGTERKFDGKLTWDMRNHDAMVVGLDAKGENKVVGPYELHRILKINCEHNKQTAISLTGNSKAKTYEVDTDISGNINYVANTMDAKIQKIVNGKKYALILNNGQVAVEM